MIRVLFLITDTALDSMARLVILNDSLRIYSAIPGALRVATAMVASGVTSRWEKPVPPVVIIRSA